MHGACRQVCMLDGSALPPPHLKMLCITLVCLACIEPGHSHSWMLNTLASIGCMPSILDDGRCSHSFLLPQPLPHLLRPPAARPCAFHGGHAAMQQLVLTSYLCLLLVAVAK